MSHRNAYSSELYILDADVLALVLFQLRNDKSKYDETNSISLHHHLIMVMIMMVVFHRTPSCFIAEIQKKKKSRLKDLFPYS